MENLKFWSSRSVYTTTLIAHPSRHQKGILHVEQFVCGTPNIKGFIARDDNRKEIVIALRGRQATSSLLSLAAETTSSADVEDFLTDSRITLVPFESPGVCAPGESRNASSRANLC
jgi:hypothetical protein